MRYLADRPTVTLAAVAHCTIKAERSVAAYRSTWWQPTVAGYLGRVSKPLILEAVTEAKGKAAADNIAAMKKGDMADRAADLLTGTGWLPAMLRAA